MDIKLTDGTMHLALLVAQHAVGTCYGSRMASVGRTVCSSSIYPLSWGRIASFAMIIGAVTFGWWGPTAGPRPAIVRIRFPVLVLMLVT